MADRLQQEWDTVQSPPVLRSRILALAWPAVLEMVLHMTVGLVDTAMVGRLGPEELAAVGIGGRVFFSVVFVFAALGIGAAALVARYVGAGDLQGANRVTAQAARTAVLTGLGVAVAGTALAPPLLGLLNAEPAVVADSIAYVRITVGASLFFLPLLVLNALLRGSGNTRLPFLLALGANGFNIVADYVLIFGHWGFPALGVAGAAWATAMAQGLGCVTVIYLLWTRDLPVRLRPKLLLVWDGDLIRRMVRLSIPAGLEEGMYALGELVFAFLVIRLGTVAFAAHQVTGAVESFSFMPGYGISLATAACVGQSLGARAPGDAVESGKQGFLVALAIMGTVALLFLLLPGPLLGLFAPGQPEVLALAVICLRLAALAQPAIAAEMILSGALRGAGETRVPLLVTSIGNWLVRIPLTLLVILVWQLPVWAVWAVAVVDWSVRALLLLYFFRRGRWLRTGV